MGWRRGRWRLWLLCPLCGASSQAVSTPTESVIKCLWGCKYKINYITCALPQILWHLGGTSSSRPCCGVSFLIGKMLPVLPEVHSDTQQSEHRLWFRVGQHLHGWGPNALWPAGNVKTQAAHHRKSSAAVGVWILLLHLEQPVYHINWQQLSLD